MRVLALDTALESVSVALYDAAQDAIAWSASVAMARGHAEALMPMVAEALAATGWVFASLDRFGTSIGPGSFTGARIGIAAAQGFGLVHQRPAVGVSTLTALAAPLLFADDKTAVLAALDARHGYVFAHLYSEDGLSVFGPERVAMPDLMEKIAAYAGGRVRLSVVGSVCEAIVEARRAREPGARTLSLPLKAPDIAWIARLAAAADPACAPARPLYLSDASVTLSDKARLLRRG